MQPWWFEKLKIPSGKKNWLSQKENLPAGTGCKLIHCLMQLKNLSLMPVLAVDEGMKKKQEQKKEFFPSGMSLGSGIPNCKDQNYGIFIMDAFIKEKM